MRRAALRFFVCCVCLSVVFITATACQAVVITLDEWGSGYADGTRLAYGLGTPSVGYWDTLYYVLPLTSVITGDVGVYEVGTTNVVYDVLRFDNVANQARVYVYSDGGDAALADTGIPSLWTSGADRDPVFVNEIGTETSNYADYTPAGQTYITYHLISDIPEPATLALLSLGGLALLKRKR
jgi:hypothetical protein